MKVLFTCLTHRTHWYPLAPLAWAFRCAGHEVRVAAEPGLIPAITDTGLTAVPIGGSQPMIENPSDLRLMESIHDDAFTHLREFDWAAKEPERWTWEYLLAMANIVVPAHDAALTNDAMLDDLVEFARSWSPDLVIWETYTLAGSITARVVGAAHARLIAGPDITMRVRRAFLERQAAQPAEHREDPTAEWLSWTLERFGCREPFSEDMVTGQWTIDSTAESTRLDLDLKTVPIRYVPHNGEAVVPHWLRAPAPRPRVCITFGVSDWIQAFMPGERVSELLEALSDLDVEIIATLNEEQRERVTKVPDNARVVDFVPLNDLLPSCALVVHHGGIGTKCNAELHGVPQIILPFGVDTTVMGQRVEELGAGLSLPIEELTTEGLRDMVVRVLEDPSFAEAAGRLRAETLAEPTPNELVPVLERLTAEHRGESSGP
ncbi:activator-dependent family glycosyltransferase [Spirillospora sp. NPDC047279]|uniref:activator-dependent family glycosyltransferase n=1 Tax=Spirillospora sp. NPDC047279 TaxID=3155478 RepID=UPI0033CBE83A